MSKLDWPAVLHENDRWLRTVVQARTGEQAAVDEVMQEIALALVRGRSPLVDATRMAPWLYRLAVLQSLLYRRRQGRQRKNVRRIAEQLRPRASDDGACDPLDWLLAVELRSEIRAALGQMPPREAELLLLKYTEGWSYRQLADRLGVGPSAIEARLHRARRRLRELLSAREIIEVNP